MRAVQRERLAELDRKGKLSAVEADQTAGLLAGRARGWLKPRCNADTDGALLATIAKPDAEGRVLLTHLACAKCKNPENHKGEAAALQ